MSLFADSDGSESDIAANIIAKDNHAAKKSLGERFARRKMPLFVDSDSEADIAEANDTENKELRSFIPL